MKRHKVRYKEEYTRRDIKKKYTERNTRTEIQAKTYIELYKEKLTNRDINRKIYI